MVEVLVVGGEFAVASACAPQAGAPERDVKAIWRMFEEVDSNRNIGMRMGDLGGRVGIPAALGIGAEGLAGPANADGK